MPQVRLSKHHAVFPPRYQASSRLFVAIFDIATQSRRLRGLVYGLPRSRFRTALVARYYHRLMEQLRDGDFGFVRAVDADADVTLFTLGTFRGRAGWEEALTEWRQAFVAPEFECSEFINPEGGEVVLSLYLGGRAATGVSVTDRVYFVITVEDGMAVRGRFTRERHEAFEAAGLLTNTYVDALDNPPSFIERLAVWMLLG